LTTTIFFTADVYSWRAPRCIIRLLRIIRAAARVNFAVTAAGPRIKQERDPTRRGRLTHEEASPKAQRSAYIKRTLHLSLSLSLSLSLYLSIFLRSTEASRESSNHPAEWLHNCTPEARDICRGRSVFLEAESISLALCWAPTSPSIFSKPFAAS
jgi:hypothetical protein